jgi:hypothetical protein
VKWQVPSSLAYLHLWDFREALPNRALVDRSGFQGLKPNGRSVECRLAGP